MNGNDQGLYWVGFDLGGTKMLATVFDQSFEVVGRRRKRTKGHEGAEAGLDRMAGTIDDALADAGITKKQVAGIGVGCPSPIDLNAGIVLDAVNLGWINVPVRDYLVDRFDCPTYVLNDVDAGVYAENRFGAARKARCVLGVFPGTGIGGGCVYDGQIICGGRLSCMEIGHIEVVANGNLCGCGRRGCLETEGSRLAISAEVAKAAFRGEAPFIMDKAGTRLSDIRSGVLADAIAKGDTVVEQIVRKAARYVGVAVANFVHLLSPDAVVLGGGLVEAMPKIYVEEVAESARGRVMDAFVDTFHVVAAELGDDATVMGAAAWAQHCTE